jgi:hypothetical protein
MRALLLASLLSTAALVPNLGHAGARPPQTAVSNSATVQWTNPNHVTYRGYAFDLSEIAARQDFAVMTDALRHQLDIVETVGLSPRVLKFFHTVPILVDEMACLGSEHPKLQAAACYGPRAPERAQRTSRGATAWDSENFRWTNPDPVSLAEDTHIGVVMVRPIMLGASSRQAQEPVILHELLHAYHNKMMPQGVKNPAVLLHYNLAKSDQLYPAEAYLLTNEREFFAVTASVFLYGKDGKEPFTRANLKQKQPDYFKYLVWLFGFDPDRAPNASPVASAD